MVDAFWKAEAAFCKDGIQAAIWNTVSKEVDWKNELDEKGYRKKGQLDDLRRENISKLSEIFETVRFSGFANKKSNSVGPHYDGELFQRGSEPDFSKLFLGAKNLKIICVRNGPGTWLYESEENLQPWQTPIGSYLFLMRTEEVCDKAVYHSWPIFEMLPEEMPRVFDVYDCFGLKPDCRPA